MRGLVWIVAIALLGLGALFAAWRLLPPGAREGAAPQQAGPRPAAPEARPDLQPVQGVVASERSASTRPPEQEQQQAAPEAPAPGLEEGGLARAGRPLRDFGAKYPGALRSELQSAAGALEQAIAGTRQQLTRAEAADLDARLANQPRAGEPTARVGALLALHDELAWLRQRLASPPADDR